MVKVYMYCTCTKSFVNSPFFVYICIRELQKGLQKCVTYHRVRFYVGTE